jgi:hypothetical protein
MLTEPFQADPDLIAKLHDDPRHFAHTIFRSEDGPTIVAVTMKAQAGAASKLGETTFFFDIGELSYGFRWTDKQGNQRFVKYSGNSEFIKLAFDINQKDIVGAAIYHFHLTGKPHDVPQGYLTKSALASLLNEDILGLSSGTVDNPPGVIHLVWVDPHSALGQRVGPDSDGDRTIEIKIYTEAFGLRWISPDDEVCYTMIAGDELSVAAIQRNISFDLGGILSLSLGVGTPTG